MPFYFYAMQSQLKYFLALHIIIFLWGFTGIIGQLVSMEAVPIVWYRVVIAMVSLAIIIPIIKGSFRLANTKQYLMVLGTGIIVALHWVTFYKSIQLSTASLGTLCLATTTLHVAWLEPIIMKRKFSWLEIIMSAVVVYGIYFVSDDFNAQEYTALAYGLSSALFAALFAVINAHLVEDIPPARISFYEMLAAAIVLSVFMLLTGDMNAEVFSISLKDFGWMLFLGIICSSLAFLASIEIVKHIGAFAASLSINLEPVYTILLAIPILEENELLTSYFYVGAAIIIGTILANAIIKRYFRNLGSDSKK